jgi:hypothetical protein
MVTNMPITTFKKVQSDPNYYTIEDVFDNGDETLGEIYDEIREYTKNHDCIGYNVFVKCFQAKRIKSELERNGYYVSTSEVQTKCDGLMTHLYISWDKET